MRFEFIASGPALVIDLDIRLLIITDPHFGIEADLAIHGVHLKSRTTERLERIKECIRSSDADRMIILGDVKHNLPVTSRQEYFELPLVFSELRKLISFQVIPGNHDTGIDRFLTSEEMLPRDGVLINDIGFFHGHTLPSKEFEGHLIICGHHHPYASVYDEVGCGLRSPVYLSCNILRGKKEGKKAVNNKIGTRALFMPSCNELAGYDLVEALKRPISPISRAIDKESAEIILPDGSFLGPVSILNGDKDD